MYSSNMPNLVRKLREDPFVKAMIARNNFESEGTTTMTVDLDTMQGHYRRMAVEDWCQTHASGRWRRVVVERRAHAILDRIIIEFEQAADAIALRGWLDARG